MPLAAGRSKATMSGNIREMIHAFKSSGKIGNTNPGSMKKALSIAAAAARRKAGLPFTRKTIGHGR